MDISDKFAEFKVKIEKDVVDTQKKITKDVMNELFFLSPHFSDSKGGQAMGEYDASHHVSIGRFYGWAISDSQPPTYSYSLSREISNINANKVDSIKHVGVVVNIKNTSDHAYDVETGVGWHKTQGYHTYAQTIDNITEKYKGIVEVK